MGSSNSPADLHPKFGFTEKQLVNEALIDSALTGTNVSRTGGLSSVIVMGTLSLTAGTGSVNLLLEGSNDGVNWFTLGQTAPTEYFTTDAQVQILNASGTGLVEVEHFDRLRARAVIISGTPTFSLAVIVTGIARDCEKSLRTVSFGPRLGLTPTVQNAASFVRPQGTLLSNCQVNASGIVLGTLTSFQGVLQGTPDSGTTWVDISTVTITADGSQLMADGDGETFFSMDAFFGLRFQVRDVGVPSVVTAFEGITLIMTMDNCDWIIDGDGTGGGGLDPNNVFISAVFGAPGPEVADVIRISVQLFDSAGAPLTSSRKIEFILYDTTQAGDLDLAGVAIFTAVPLGTAIDGLTTNRLVLTTDAAGLAAVEVTDTAAETTFLTTVNPRGPQTTAQLIVEASEASLTFA